MLVNNRRPAAATLARMTTEAVHDRRLIEGVVANLPLFYGLPAAEVRSLSAQSWAMPTARGATVLHAGARAPGVFALAYGSVKLVLRNGGGEERVLRVVAARQTFGEAIALVGRPSPYFAVALSDAKVVVIPSAPLFGLLGRDTGFAKALVRNLAEAELQLCAEIGSATLQRGAQRLAGYLDALANGGSEVQLPFSKTLLAARLGMKKETLSRLLRQFTEDGVIVVTRRRVAILDRERLKHPTS
jgi:CRP-like cAMP-binding protein